MLTENIAIAIPPNIAARISKGKWMRREREGGGFLLGSIEFVLVSMVVLGLSVLIEGETAGTNKCCCL